MSFRIRWLLPLVVLGLALGGMLVWRALEPDARRELADSSAPVVFAPPQTPPTARELERELEREDTTAARAALDTAEAPRTAPAAVEDDHDPRELAEAHWVSGRLVFPPGTPLDEDVRVVARGSKFERGAFHRARVEPDGSFRVAFAKASKRGDLALEARYLYLDASTKLSLGAPPADLVLAPKLGVRLHVECRVPAGRADLARRARGAPIEFWRDDGALGNSTVRGPYALDDALEFELEGLRPAKSFTVSVLPLDLCIATARVDEPKPGTTASIVLELREGARVSGRVTAPEGVPVRGASVTWESDTSPRPEPSTTGADGAFSLTGIVPGRAWIVATRDGFLPSRQRTRKLVDGEHLEGLVIVLDRGLAIRGRVQWPDGAPAAEAEVRALPERKERGASERDLVARSGDDGTFELLALSERTYSLTASARPAPRPNAKPDPNAPKWRAELRAVKSGARDVQFTLSAGIAFAGRVVDETGAPVTKFRILVEERETVDRPSFGYDRSRSFRAADGGYVYDGLRPGWWQVSAEANGLPSRPVRIELPLAGEAPMLVVPRRAEVRGIVRDPQGRPVDGASVRRVSPNADGSVTKTGGTRGLDFATTDGKGRFEFDRLPAGSVALVARAPDLAPSAEVEAEAVAGHPREVELALRAGGTIRVRVLDVEGQPEPGRTITWNGKDEPNLHAETDARGECSFEHVRPGTCGVRTEPSRAQRLRATRTGGELDSELLDSWNFRSLVTVVDGAVVEVELGGRAFRPITLRGRVTRGGHPVAGVRVRASREARGYVNAGPATSGADGAYELVLRGPGRWSVAFEAPSGTVLTRTLEVTDGTQITLDAAFPERSVRGRVVDHEGRGRAEEWLGLSPDPGALRADGDATSSTVQSAADGRFTFDDIAPGPYTIGVGFGVSQGNFGAVRRPVVVPETGEVPEIVIVLERAGFVTGTLVGRDGQPQSNARVAALPAGPGHEQSTYTSADGRFLLGGLAPGAYLVGAAAGSDVTHALVRVDVRSEETLEVALALARGGALLVTLPTMTWSAGRIVDARGVDVAPLCASSLVRFAGEGGSVVRFAGIPPGRYRLTTWDRSGREWSADADVVAGAETSVQLAPASAPR